MRLFPVGTDAGIDGERHVEMRRRGHGPDLATQISLTNPLTFLSQCPNFRPAALEPGWLSP